MRTHNVDSNGKDKTEILSRLWLILFVLDDYSYEHC